MKFHHTFLSNMGFLTTIINLSWSTRFTFWVGRTPFPKMVSTEPMTKCCRTISTKLWTKSSQKTLDFQFTLNLGFKGKTRAARPFSCQIKRSFSKWWGLVSVSPKWKTFGFPYRYQSLVRHQRISLYLIHPKDPSKINHPISPLKISK